MEEQEDYFNQCKERLLQEWYNFYFEQSYLQAFSTLESVVISSSFEKKALRKILEKFTFEDFVVQSKEWLKSGRFVWYITGNISKDSAISTVE